MSKKNGNFVRFMAMGLAALMLLGTVFSVLAYVLQ